MRQAKTSSVRAVERAFLLLEALGRSEQGLTLSQLARRLTIPRSTAYCLLETLERCGYLHHERPGGRYTLSLKLFSLANSALHAIALRKQAAPVLWDLMRKTRLTVHLGILEHHEVVLVDRVEPPSPVRIATWLGKRMGVHCTALGKALTAWLPEADIDRLIRERGLLRHNENTIVSARRLKEELRAVRVLGYAVDNEEEEIGMRCVGAPVFDADGRVIAAVSVAGTSDQIDEANVQELAAKVKAAAKAISESCGWRAAGEAPHLAVAAGG